eukprot:3855810-Pleurochrysis_carterae.AAC.1
MRCFGQEQNTTAQHESSMTLASNCCSEYPTPKQSHNAVQDMCVQIQKLAHSASSRYRSRSDGVQLRPPPTKVCFAEAPLAVVPVAGCPNWVRCPLPVWISGTLRARYRIGSPALDFASRGVCGWLRRGLAKRMKRRMVGRLVCCVVGAGA